MWHRQISVSALVQSTAWKVERFKSCSDYTGSSTAGISLYEIVKEREEIADPTSVQFSRLPYLGLDAIEPGTGEILFVRTASEQSIRSRSKVFREGDVLYGRLRAYLNKVACIDGGIPVGTCSGEFYVLQPDTSKVYPLFLQWLLLSNQMVEYVKLRLAGATHPRLGLDDLMSYRVELPTRQRQLKAVNVINRAISQRRELLATLTKLPEKTTAQIRKVAYG